MEDIISLEPTTNVNGVGLNLDEFSTKNIYNLVKNKKWNLALTNGQLQDVEPILKNWLYVNAPNINYKDQNIVNLVKNWYFHFKSIGTEDNPFFSYLKSLKKLGVKPKYNDLVAVNNKFQEGVLTKEDLSSDVSGNIYNEVLANKDFYNKKLASQNFWLDIYAFFSDPDKVGLALNNYPSDVSISIGNDKYTKTELLSSDIMLRDCLLFEGGNPNEKLRNARTVETAIDGMSKYVSEKDKVQGKSTKKTKDYKSRNGEH